MKQIFEISRAYSVPSLNGKPANICDQNPFCETFMKLCNIHFHQSSGGIIGSLLGANISALTDLTKILQAGLNQPFAVDNETRKDFGWKLL